MSGEKTKQAENFPIKMSKLYLFKSYQSSPVWFCKVLCLNFWLESSPIGKTRQIFFFYFRDHHGDKPAWLKKSRVAFSLVTVSPQKRWRCNASFSRAVRNVFLHSPRHNRWAVMSLSLFGKRCGRESFSLESESPPLTPWSCSDSSSFLTKECVKMLI